MVNYWVELRPEPLLSCPLTTSLHTLLHEAARSIIRQAEHPASQAFGQAILRSTQLPMDHVQAWHSQYGRHVGHLCQVFGHHTAASDPRIYAWQFVQVILGCLQGGMASGTACQETYVASSVELFVKGTPRLLTARTVATDSPDPPTVGCAGASGSI